MQPDRTSQNKTATQKKSKASDSGVDTFEAPEASVLKSGEREGRTAMTAALAMVTRTKKDPQKGLLCTSKHFFLTRDWWLKPPNRNLQATGVVSSMRLKVVSSLGSSSCFFTGSSNVSGQI